MWGNACGLRIIQVSSQTCRYFILKKLKLVKNKKNFILSDMRKTVFQDSFVKGMALLGTQHCLSLFGYQHHLLNRLKVTGAETCVRRLID
jgi:hypothetical protein